MRCCAAAADQQQLRDRDLALGVAVRVDGPITANSADFAIRYALEGTGIVLTPGYVAAEAIAAGRLTVLFEGMPDYGFGLYAAYLPSRHLDAKVRSFIDFIRAGGADGSSAFHPIPVVPCDGAGFRL